MASKKSSKTPNTMWGAAGRSYLKIDPFPPVAVSWRSWRKARREAEFQAAWEARKRQEVCGLQGSEVCGLGKMGSRAWRRVEQRETEETGSLGH